MTTQIQTTIETNSNLLFRASIHGDAEEVKRLITVVDEQTKDSALGYAAKYGHIECIKLLIPVSNAKANNSFALRAAAENGHLQCVKLLIPVSDPKACDSFALAVAVAEGHIECVKLLLPVSDPKANNSCALRWAAESGHTEIVKLLIPVSECNSVIEQMQKRNGMFRPFPPEGLHPGGGKSILLRYE